jgi:predicted HAD superfamily Cof-like phosphohydrolase
MRTNHADVWAFHTKFGVPAPELPQLMNEFDFGFRLKFMYEELQEIEAAQMKQDLAGVADGLIDLVYVALGTAIWMGLPWQLLWDEVQAANMAKITAPSAAASRSLTGRGHKFDVVKPEGWKPPRIQEVLDAFQHFIQTKDPSKIQELQVTRKGWVAPDPKTHVEPAKQE